MVKTRRATARKDQRSSRKETDTLTLSCNRMFTCVMLENVGGLPLTFCRDRDLLPASFCAEFQIRDHCWRASRRSQRDSPNKNRWRRKLLQGSILETIARCSLEQPLAKKHKQR